MAAAVYVPERPTLPRLRERGVPALGARHADGVRKFAAFRGPRSTEGSRAPSEISTRGKCAALSAELVAPVEVARATPEAALGRLLLPLLGGLAGPRAGGDLGDDVGLDAVHRLLDPRLLLALDERVVLERVLDRVVLDLHRVFEVRVLLLQLQVILDDLREERRRLNRHACPPTSGAGPRGEHTNPVCSAIPASA